MQCRRGYLTVQAAGNDGNITGTVGSIAPWILTFAASCTDRRILDKVVLGNGKTLEVIWLIRLFLCY